MSFVFDVKSLKNPDNEFVSYIMKNKHAVRNLKISPTSITFHDTPQKNNYATFTLDTDDGTVTSEKQHLSFSENNESENNNEVWKNLHPNDWIDEFEIVEILEQYVITTSDAGKRKSKRNTRKAVRKASRKTKNRQIKVSA